jgi:parallel beta-helix repeat protein
MHVLSCLDILKIMIGHPHGDDIGNLMQTGNNINFSLYGICLDNRDYPVIRKNTMDLDSSNGGNVFCNSFSPSRCTRYNNT